MEVKNDMHIIYLKNGGAGCDTPSVVPVEGVELRVSNELKV